MTRRESVELSAIVLGIGAAFIIHFGFGERPSLESSTPATGPAFEVDFKRAERGSSAARIAAASKSVRERKRATPHPTPTRSLEQSASRQDTSRSPALQGPSLRNAPSAPLTRQPSSQGKSPSSGHSSPSGGGGTGAQFDDSG
jgi:hypothetical protein